MFVRAKVHKDFRTKKRVLGFKCKTRNAFGGASSKGPNPQKNAGLMLSKTRMVHAFSEEQTRLDVQKRIDHRFGQLMSGLSQQARAKYRQAMMEQAIRECAA